MLNYDQFVTPRVRAIDASGIRRVFDLAAKLDNPINLSIGQPDFDVPDEAKEAACEAIRRGQNRYTVTQGMAELQSRVRQELAAELPSWSSADKEGGQGYQLLVTSGVSGGLMLALLVAVGPGDEVIIPDPYFVMYKHLVTLAGATPVYVDTYPDFALTAERIEPHITEQTKMVLFNSPSNPTGYVATEAECEAVARLCNERGLLLLSDEIYDQFCYEKSPRPGAVDDVPRCPTPAAYTDQMLLLRGYSKTYGMTGWRLGYCAGPAPIVSQMTKLQQYSFVCAPSMAQLGGIAAMDLDMSPYVEAYARKRDRVREKLGDVFELAGLGGAFYAFPKVPTSLNLTGSQFVERAIKHNVLIIPGSVFSGRDTHFRISYACDDAMLDKGLDVLLELAN